MLKHLTICILLIASLFCIKQVAAAEHNYYPYPIVFVHGLNSSDKDTWEDMRDALRLYFRDGLDYKYPDHTGELNYFVGCDYEEINDGDISQIGHFYLGSKIAEALSYYPASIPDEERKVVIVCHSMGGLATRRLLNLVHIYEKKIARVVFIDTPHLGSPYASCLWLFDKVVKDSITPFTETKYYAYAAFRSFFPNAVEYVEYPYILKDAASTIAHIKAALFAIEHVVGIDPAGKAIEQMRIPEFTYYEKIFNGFLGVHSLRLYKEYEAYDTFLYANNNNIGIPNKYKIIRGVNEPAYLYASWGLAYLADLDSPFTFPTLAGELQNLDNMIKMGDGVVTRSSQEAVTMDDVGTVNPPITSFHCGITAKTECINKVIDAIDDSPVIENMYVAKWPAMPAQIVVKVKDYLLADIEIASVTVDGVPVDLATALSDFNDGENHYKPYVKFDKVFLTERQDPDVRNMYGNPITLKPGEFYVTLDLDANESHIVEIEVKNMSRNSSTKKKLQLVVARNGGYWTMDSITGNWSTFYSQSTPIGPYNLYNINARYDYFSGYPADPPEETEMYNGVAYLYKIGIPQNSSVVSVDIVLNRPHSDMFIYYGVQYFYHGGTAGPTSYPPCFTPEFNIDYSFNLHPDFSTPTGDHNLFNLTFDVTETYDSSNSGFYKYRSLVGIAPPGTLNVNIPIENPDLESIWLTIYPKNLQSIVSEVRPQALAARPYSQPDEMYYWGVNMVDYYTISDIKFNYQLPQ